MPWLMPLDKPPPRRRLRAGPLLTVVVVMLAIAAAYYLLRSDRTPSTDAFNDAYTADNALIAVPGAPQNGSLTQSPHVDHHAARSPGGSTRPTQEARERRPEPASHATRHSRADREPSHIAASVTAHAMRERSLERPVRLVRSERRAAPAPHRETERDARAWSGAVVQLGAFATFDAAECAWRRYSTLRPFAGSPHRIERVSVQGRSYYRLRVAVRQVPSFCKRDSDRCLLVQEG